MKRERKNTSVKSTKKISQPNKHKQYSPKKWSGAAKAVSSTQIFIWLAVISVFTIIAYSSSFKNGITNWDDQEYVIDNPHIKVIDSKSITDIFTTLNYMGNYHPLTIVSLAIDYQFAKESKEYKDEINPFPFHLTNFILHLIVTLLVFWFVYKLFDNFTIAVIAGLLFGVSALHVESVAWISERKDVLYSAFFVGGLVSYLKFLETKSTSAYILTLVLFVLSLLSKGQAVSLAVSLVAIDWFRGRKLLDVKVIMEKIPFFLLALTFGIVAIIAQKEGDAIISSEAYPFYYRIGFAGYAYMQYIIELTIPVGFSAINPYPDIINKTIPGYYWLYLLPALTTIYGLYYTIKTKRKAATFGIAFFIINIFLLLQLLPVGSAIHADRYAYIPSIGYFILAGVLADDLIKRRKSLKMTVFVLIGLFASVQTYATIERSKVWESSESLWADTVLKSPKAVVAWNNKGSVNDRIASKYAEKFDFVNSKKYRLTAIEDFTHAVKWKPDYVNAYYNRGSSKQSFGKNQKLKQYSISAIADFDTALMFDPIFAPAYHNRGTAKDETGNSAEAIVDFTAAIDIKPNDDTYYVNRGVAYGKLSKFKESIADFEKSIQLNPTKAQVYCNMGFAKVLSADNDGGLKDYDKAIEINPEFTTAYYNRGILYQRLNRFQESVDDFTKVMKLNPTNIDALYFRGVSYIQLGKNAEACQDFNKSLSSGDKRSESMINQHCK